MRVEKTFTVSIVNSLYLKSIFGLSAVASSASLLAMSTTYTYFTPRLDLHIAPIKVCSVEAPGTITLLIDSAEPGENPAPVTDASSTYSISTNETTSLSASASQVPEGIDFFAQYSASATLPPVGPIQLQTASGSSAGSVNVFDAIAPGIHSGSVKYTASAPITTKPFEGQSFPVEHILQ